ncbi:hypothetical protein NJ7G_2512 [Natrinema sp. J7-2]|nr:hypothetical protein NJ7G_2512 [Natrinema sp. J7-2]
MGASGTSLTITGSAVATTDKNNGEGDHNKKDNGKRHKGGKKGVRDTQKEELIQEVDKKVEEGEILLGAVGEKAPDDWEPHTQISTAATRTDSSTMYLGFNDSCDGGRRIQLQTEMNGSFSSGLKATWESDGSTEASFSPNNCYHGVNTESVGSDNTDPDTVSVESEFSIGGIEVTVDSAPSFSASDGYSATWSTELSKSSGDDTTEVSHTYKDMSASSYIALYEATQKDSVTFEWDNEYFSLNTQVSKA